MVEWRAIRVTLVDVPDPATGTGPAAESGGGHAVDSAPEVRQPSCDCTLSRDCVLLNNLFFTMTVN